MTKYGVAISQSGTPIDRASDYQRIIDTRWRTIPIHMSVKIQGNNFLMNAKGAPYKILDHNLGYIPAFEAPFFNTRFETSGTARFSYFFVADKTSIYLVIPDSAFDPPDVTIDGYINVFAVNMQEDFKSDRAGLKATVSRSDRGIKVIGNGKYAAHDASDTNPLGFGISTDSKAIGIDQIGTVPIRGGDAFTLTLGTGTVTHSLNYPPLIKLQRIFKNTNGVLTLGIQNFPAPSNEPLFYGPLRLDYVTIQPQRVIVSDSYDFTDHDYRFILFREPTEIAG